MRKRRFCGKRALYRRLLLDKDYVDVRFDILSGGVSAIHKYHRFDQQSGPYGIKRGEYERIVVETLRRKGHVVILGSERAAAGIKTPDGTLNGAIMDIKTVESVGRWAIKDKLHAATKQRIDTLILFFPNQTIYSEKRIRDGWCRHLRDDSGKDYPYCIRRVLCVVEGNVFAFHVDYKQEKPSCDDFSEGSKETGGVPLSPSMQR